ncbi:MAG: DUF6524 family protein [Alphaproteobacteria bacterium]
MSPRRAPPGSFGPLRLLARLLLAAFIVFAIYNPSGRSYFHWAMAEGAGPLQIGTGIMLAGAVILFVRIGTASFGRIRFFLGLVVIVLLGIGLRGVMTGPNGGALAGYVTLAAIAAWLTMGLSWPYLSRRLTGQLQSRKV